MTRLGVTNVPRWPATGFASPIAILTDLVIATDEADARAGVRVRAATSISFEAEL